MDLFEQISDSAVFAWVILPFLIFLARICDMTLGTIRIIFISRGKKLLAPIFGFFEVSIWLLAMNQILQNLDSPICFFAYALGFAAGCYVGILIEEKLAMGYLIIRVFVSEESEMKERLYDAGFGVTSIDGHGKTGDVKILFTVIKRKNLAQAVEIIEACQAKVFYSVEDAKFVNQGVFSAGKPSIFPNFTSSKKNLHRRSK